MNIAEDNKNTRVPLNLALRQRREELCLTQAEIAEVLRVTPESITQWECGRRRMALDKIPMLADALDLDQKQLCIQALAEFHPRFHAALFAPDEPKEVAA